MSKIRQLSVVAVVAIVALLVSDRLGEDPIAMSPQVGAESSVVVEPSVVAELSAVIEPSKLMGDSAAASPGIVIQPRVVESARDMVHLYPSSATLVLPELSPSEEQEIMDLISREDTVYLTIKRDTLIADTNWKLLGTKKAADIWQLHIKSPRAVGMQVLFSQATLAAGMEIKIYSGQKSIASHIGEHLGSPSEDTEDFWSTHVPGDTIVIEVWVPQGSNLNPSNFPFEIKFINHHFRAHATDSLNLKHFVLGASDGALCNAVNSPPCPAEEDFPLYRAIARLLYTEPNGHTGQCTGGFINDNPANSELYFLTALHCISPGFSEDTAKGSAINAQIRTAESRCSNSSERLVSNDIRFIAANEQADWALLWVNKNRLQRADGLSLPITAPTLLGWDSGTLQIGTLLENLHYGASIQQNYAEVRVSNFFQKLESTSGILSEVLVNYQDLFLSCVETELCTHYSVNYVEGAVAGGASGSLVWSTPGRVRGVLTHGSCRVSRASRFHKIYEDGRVQCALRDGSAYYPGNGVCDDSDRPVYEPLLTSLSPSAGTVYPSFHSRIMRYTIVVDNHVERITLAMQANDLTYPITVFAASGNQVTSRPTLSLDEGLNTIIVRVQTVPSNPRIFGESQHYEVKVIRLPRQAVNPVGTWESALTSRYLQCRFSPILIDRFLISPLVVSEITRTSEGTLNILNQSESILYTETDKPGPNRVRLNARYRGVTDTMSAILMSDEEVIGLGTQQYIHHILNLPCTLSYLTRFRSVSLASLSLQAGTLSPSFRSAIKNYTATVGSGVEQLVIRANASYSSQTVIINGTISPIVPLKVGNNTITIKVASQRSTATATYTLQVTRLEPQKPRLTELLISAGVLSPRFDSETTSYTAVVGSSLSQINVVATADNHAHTIAINGTNSSLVPLQIGENTITIELSSRERSETTIYTLQVTRLGLTDLRLSAGTLSPRFDSNIAFYTAAVENSVNQINIAAVAGTEADIITINGSEDTAVPLVVGNNTIEIELRSANGEAAESYTVIARRLSTAILTKLSVETASQKVKLNPSFSSTILSYGSVVSTTITSIAVTPEAGPGRIIRISYTPQGGETVIQSVSSGSPIVVAPLSRGTNIIYIDVTHNSARERYILKITLGIYLRLKVFLEGALQ